MSFKYFVMLAIIAGSNCLNIDLKCDFIDDSWNYLGNVTTCFANNLIVTSPEDTITTFNGIGKPDRKVKGFFAEYETINYFPKGIEELFPNLEGIVITQSKLKVIKKNDLERFTNLTVLGLQYNDLVSLPSDLLDRNQKLKKAFFSFNRRHRAVGENLFQNEAGKMKLEQVSFEDAGCIDMFASNPNEIEDLKRKIREKCLTPEDYKKELKDLYKQAK